MRARILEVATRLFDRHGVRAVGTSCIIRESGIGKNLLYQHFPAKADLVAAYLDESYRDKVRTTLRPAEPGDPRAEILAFIRSFVAEPRTAWLRGCPARNYLVEFPDDGSDVLGPVRAAADRLREGRAVLDELIARLDVERPGELAEQLWLMIDGLCLQAAYRSRFDGAAAAGVRAAIRTAETLIDVACAPS
ncbi:TetR/AcrR family transcriptional regulator [Nonomuraea fuscirosea]|uniref:TetR/AcrR family transcriptional regulator n=1 Tax=Nonomuraea fuscirosea TaxID=1291556 RepID=UPI002DD7D052|nr:helix-turn-helix domain-containing protein [Nonomuraea fuscirosea]WSA49977.1 TetR/AcrR family transcriptional regulator [Nonomuraea fuscirosea]